MVRAGCIAGRAPTGRTGPPGFCHRLLTACGETHVSAEVGQFSRWGRGARPTRRVREEYLVYFDRNATQNGAKRSGSGGMHRRPSPHRENWAAWVLPPAVEARSRVPWPAAAIDTKRTRRPSSADGTAGPRIRIGLPGAPGGARANHPGRFGDAPRPGAAVQAGRSCRPIRVHSQGTRRTDRSRR